MSRRSAWWWFVPVAAVFLAVATHRMELPGIYADSINPDYLVTRILNPDAEPGMVWVLVGNSLLGDRAFVLPSLYHGSQQFWLGLPLYAIYGMSVTGARLTHATFALFVLAAMFALLLRGGVRPWLAAIVGIALAVDPAFSYSFRVQAYIVVAPAAWLMLAVCALMRASDAQERNPGRWLFASGAFCGLAAVGYFVWAFMLPPIAVAAATWMRKVRLARPPLVVWVAGLATGGIAYPLGYFLVVRKLGSLEGLAEFAAAQQGTLGVFRSQLPLSDRVGYAARMLTEVFGGDWHQAMMFNGEFTPLDGVAWKVAILVALPYALWIYAEARRQASPLLRLLVSLPPSFLAISLVFGDRLGGHHFAALVPVHYAMLGAALATLPAWGASIRRIAAVVPLALLAAVNVSGQFRVAETLATTRGQGQLSDAVHRFAADLNAMKDKPFVWFAEPAPALPLTLLTQGTVAMGDRIDDPGPRQRLCAGRDVFMVRLPGHFSEPRGREWQDGLGWDAYLTKRYDQADGRVVFEVNIYRGRRDGPGCA